MTSTKPDRLLKAILIWTVITALLIWLPLIRGLMDGDAYQWGNALWGVQLSGRGLGGHYWVLPILAGLATSLLYLGWRGAKQPFHWLLLLWHLPLAIGVISLSLRFPDDFRFRGDTLGVDVSLAWVGPLLFGGFAILSLIWVIRDLRLHGQHELAPLQRFNKIMLAVVLGMLPVQFALLRFGNQHGTNDQIGVILTMLQWVMLNIAFSLRGSTTTNAA